MYVYFWPTLFISVLLDGRDSLNGNLDPLTFTDTLICSRDSRNGNLDPLTLTDTLICSLCCQHQSRTQDQRLLAGQGVCLSGYSQNTHSLSIPLHFLWKLCEQPWYRYSCNLQCTSSTSKLLLTRFLTAHICVLEPPNWSADKNVSQIDDLQRYMSYIVHSPDSPDSSRMSAAPAKPKHQTEVRTKFFHRLMTYSNTCRTLTWLTWQLAHVCCTRQTKAPNWSADKNIPQTDDLQQYMSYTHLTHLTARACLLYLPNQSGSYCRYLGRDVAAPACVKINVWAYADAHIHVYKSKRVSLCRFAHVRGSFSSINVGRAFTLPS
jgi:hypothetical protein